MPGVVAWSGTRAIYRALSAAELAPPAFPGVSCESARVLPVDNGAYAERKSFKSRDAAAPFDSMSIGWS